MRLPVHFLARPLTVIPSCQNTTQSAVLKILSDILLAVGAGDLPVVMYLYLSAAINTVDGPRRPDLADDNFLRSV